ncbi:MAG TPA: polyribonucleotide nucleotidyltransferase [Gammaproteobacteria bacterium]|nr:polyribonucleotide nucleotidyltransferase [Gammaproteobacteria bacterium]
MKLSRKIVSFVSMSMIVVQLIGCGTLLYPERRGQTTGQIDWAVVGMDAVGVLFFLLPGMVAFGVDFYTGAIYLPDSEQSEGSAVKKVVLGQISLETLNAQLSAELGQQVQLQHLSYQVSQLADEEALIKQLSKF